MPNKLIETLLRLQAILPDQKPLEEKDLGGISRASVLAIPRTVSSSELMVYNNVTAEGRVFFQGKGKAYAVNMRGNGLEVRDTREFPEGSRFPMGILGPADDYYLTYPEFVKKLGGGSVA